MLRSMILSITVAVILLSASISWAQTDGSIRGYVRDEQGGSLPGATVTATSPSNARTLTAVTDEAGFYRLLNVPPGTFALSAELQGFSKFVRDNVEIRAGLNLNIDVTLKLGALAETINVKADTPLLETKDAVQAVNVSGELQQSVPLAARRHWSEFL